MIDAELAKLVDKALKEISGKSLVSAQEMTDLLLDIRLYLVSEDVERARE